MDITNYYELTVIVGNNIEQSSGVCNVFLVETVN